MLIAQINNVSKHFLIPNTDHGLLREYFSSILLKKQTHGFSKIQVLNNITFQVSQGDWIGLIGPNGSGKTTLLKLIAGILYPDQGSIKQSGNTLSILELGVGFQPELHVIDNIFLQGAIYGLTRRQLKQKIDPILLFANLKRFKFSQVKNLSSGMQARLAFSIVLHLRADLYLFDEVLSVGDTSFQKKALVKLQKKIAKENAAVIFVSHDVKLIKKICNRIIEINNGKLLKRAI